MDMVHSFDKKEIEYDIIHSNLIEKKNQAKYIKATFLKLQYTLLLSTNHVEHKNVQSNRQSMIDELRG